MPDDELNADFAGLARAAANAFKPHFADVEARAARRRRRLRTLSAGLLALGVSAGGGTALALTADRTPTPVVTPTLGPFRTSYAPAPGSSRVPQAQPSYVRIGPGAFDVAEPDKPLTGIFTQMFAGDLDHLYLEYRDCEGKKCRSMLASSSDRGRTWRKTPMHPDVQQHKRYGALVLAHGNLVVAADGTITRSGFDTTQPPASYLVSTDGGTTWKRSAMRKVETLPADATVYIPSSEWIAAVNPATGDMTWIKPSLPRFPGSLWSFAMPIDNQPSSGIWMLDRQPMPVSSPGPSPGAEVRRESKLIVLVSRDGGKTWDVRVLPDTEQDGVNSGMLTTVDGQTLYLADRLDGGAGVQLHSSTDGGQTWQTGARLDLGGPMLSLLPLGGGNVQIESPKDTLRSTDGGRTFTRVGESLGARAYALPGGGYAIPTNNNEASIWLSEDGASWTYVPRPEVP
ncbi:glycoside hydrolase [Actinoplanes sp. NBC_00393]|uniref:sialidase family protein n=1 Tax=Actinoplanes sp. NBC_00393 TaxID=2975953 RepID=UPI002E1F01AA